MKKTFQDVDELIKSSPEYLLKYQTLELMKGTDINYSSLQGNVAKIIYKRFPKYLGFPFDQEWGISLGINDGFIVYDSCYPSLDDEFIIPGGDFYFDLKIRRSTPSLHVEIGFTLFSEGMIDKRDGIYSIRKNDALLPTFKYDNTTGMVTAYSQNGITSKSKLIVKGLLDKNSFTYRLDDDYNVYIGNGFDYLILIFNLREIFFDTIGYGNCFNIKQWIFVKSYSTSGTLSISLNNCGYNQRLECSSPAVPIIGKNNIPLNLGNGNALYLVEYTDLMYYKNPYGLPQRYEFNFCRDQSSTGPLYVGFLKSNYSKDTFSGKNNGLLPIAVSKTTISPSDFILCIDPLGNVYDEGVQSPTEYPIVVGLGAKYYVSYSIHGKENVWIMMGNTKNKWSWQGYKKWSDIKGLGFGASSFSNIIISFI